MQTKRAQQDCGMMLLPSLEEFVPRDHYLRRLNRVLDLAFVHEVVRDRYCQDNGRPSIDPEVVIRLFLLQAIEGLSSVRRLMQRVHVDLAFRWFIGYRVDETLPDHSTLSRALDRFGDEVFNELFVRSISQCQASGLIEGRVLHVDATTIRADIDRNRVGQPDSSDKDARYGRFPDGTKKPGYKQHTVVDEQKRVVVGLSVSPANEHEHDSAVDLVDQAVEHTGRSPETVCADAAYGSGRNRAAMEDRDIRLVSPPQKPLRLPDDHRLTIDDFTYHHEDDRYTCPAGATLHYVGGVKGRSDKRRYAASNKACRHCPLKEQCTKASRRQLKVSIYRDAYVRLQADSKTDSFKQLYRSRAPVVEGVFAEAKQWHGLRRAWRRGLGKMRVQCLLIAAVLNLKRLAAVFSLRSGFNNPFVSVIAAFWRTILSALGRMSPKYVTAKKY
jgi:transposase